MALCSGSGCALAVAAKDELHEAELLGLLGGQNCLAVVRNNQDNLLAGANGITSIYCWQAYPSHFLLEINGRKLPVAPDSRVLSTSTR